PRQGERENAADDHDGNDDRDDPALAGLLLFLRVLELEADDLVLGLGGEPGLDLGGGHGLQYPARRRYSAATAYSRQSPRMPRTSSAPRSSSWTPEPATRSLTVCDTRTSPEPA